MQNRKDHLGLPIREAPSDLAVEFVQNGTPAAHEPLPGGSLTVNLTVLIRRMWDRTEKYLHAAMTAKAARELGPKAERQNLDRIKKGFDMLVRSGRVPAAELEQIGEVLAKAEKEVKRSTK